MSPELDQTFRIKEEEFLNEETLCGYFISHEMKCVFKKFLNILQEVQAICKRHGLRYVVSGGSLLGAVRHKGFIPWDDDIDIAMFRSDYDRFVEIAKKELRKPLFLQTSETDCRNIRYARVMDLSTSCILPYVNDYEVFCKQGICIDVFPMDGVVSSKWKYSLQIWLADKFSMIYHYAHQIIPPRNVFRRLKGALCKAIYKIVGKSRFYQLRESVFRCFSPKKCGKCGLISFFGRNTCSNVDESYFRDTIEVPFEYIKVSIPRDYDPVLTTQYGDWRKFKPGTQNRPCDVEFDVNEPYDKKIRQKFGETPEGLVSEFA